jgi:hypothetical protein
MKWLVLGALLSFCYALFALIRGRIRFLEAARAHNSWCLLPGGLTEKHDVVFAELRNDAGLTRQAFSRTGIIWLWVDTGGRLPPELETFLERKHTWKELREQAGMQ